MFIYFYQVCLIIFLLQGISSPLLILFSGILWYRQSRKLEKLRAEIENLPGKNMTADARYESILLSIPKLKPLKCAGCGAGMLLRETETFCPNCHRQGNLPEDYRAMISLKSKGQGLLKRAVKHWRAANILTSSPVSWSFFLLIFIEPLVLFPTVLIGSNMFPETRIDRAFESFGETWALVTMLVAFLGFINWMIVFILLANLSRNLRSQLTFAVPPAADEAQISGSGTFQCRTCGGSIEYDGDDFASLCSYCNVVNLRVQLIRRARLQSEKRQTKTRSALFGAMEIIEDFIGSFFFVSLILGVASFLLIVIYVVKNAR